MSAPDPIELLSRIAPVSDEEAADLFGATGRERLLEAITHLSLRPARPARRRIRRPLVLAVAVLVAIGTATVAWAIARSGARDTTSIDCVIAGVDSGIDATSGNPAADCAAEWQRERGTPAPPLVAYANSYGGVTVLPRSKKPPAGWRTLHSQDVALIELQESLDDYLNGLNSTCFTNAQATAFTREQLDALGFARWTVNIRSIPASTSSASSPTATSSSGRGARPAPAVSTAGPICTGSGLVDPTTTTVTLISGPTGGSPPPNWLPGRLATSLRPLTKDCLSLPAMRNAVEQRASQVGLSPSPPLIRTSYDLNIIKDDKLRCTTLYQTVEGGINLILRGPTHRP
jgi:hypothetical protein